MPSSTMLMDDYLLRDEILYIAEQRSIRRIAQLSPSRRLHDVCHALMGCNVSATFAYHHSRLLSFVFICKRLLLIGGHAVEISRP